MATMILALLEEHENAKQVKDCLEDCGHKIIVVDTFVKAKALLKIQKIDLIISNVHLENGGNVFDFLRWEKKAQPHPTSLLFCSATNLRLQLNTCLRVCGYRLACWAQSNTLRRMPLM